MKPTTAQLALLHVAESAGASALLTLLVGILQQLTAGQISVSQLLTVLGSGFFVAMCLIYKTVKASPDLKQAETDTAGQIQQFVEARFTAFETRLAQWFARQPIASQLTSPQLPAAVRSSTPAPAQQPSQPLPQQAYGAPLATSFSSSVPQMQASTTAPAPVNWQSYQPPARPGTGG